jgi:hypothetical protein
MIMLVRQAFDGAPIADIPLDDAGGRCAGRDGPRAHRFFSIVQFDSIRWIDGSFKRILGCAEQFQ